MYDKELACRILNQVLTSAKTIRTRFEPVGTIEDFTNTPGGMEKFDSICVNSCHSWLIEHPEIEWKKVKGLRDIITHQYFDVNVEAIFDVCDEKLPELIKSITAMLVETQK